MYLTNADRSGGCEADACLIIRLAHALFRAKGTHALLSERMSLSLIELSVLYELADNRIDSDSNVFAHDLTAAFHTSKATISLMLGAMEKRGLVRRDFNPSNRRTRVITLTEAGRQALADAEGLYVEAVGGIVDAYGQEEARALAEQLERLIDLIEQQRMMGLQSEPKPKRRNEYE